MPQDPARVLHRDLFLREAPAYQDALARDEARRVGLMGSSREVGSGGLECHGKSAASQPMERAGDLRQVLIPVVCGWGKTEGYTRKPAPPSIRRHSTLMARYSQ
jgi:hypothetical protein